MPQGAALNLTGGSFQGNFSFALTQGAAVDITGGNYQGTLTGSGGGTVSLASGTLTLTGATTFNFPAGMFQWSGWINTNGQTLTNPSTGFMTITNPSGTNAYLIGGGTLVNQGTIDETGTGGLTSAATPGLPTRHSTTRPCATFAFQGDTGISSDTWWGTFSNEGTLTKTSGSGTATVNGVIFANAGRLEVDAGTLAVSCGLTNLGGTYRVAQGAALDLAGGTFQGGFSFTVAPGAVVGLTGGSYQGTFTGAGGGTVLLASGTLTLIGATTFDFPTGMFQWSGGVINTYGQTLTNASTGFMTLANPTGSDVLLAGGGTLVNQGTIDETGAGGLDLQSAWGNSNSTTLDNQAGATFDFQDDGGIGDGGNGGTFSNEGTFTKTGGSGTSTVSGILFSNAGTLAVDSGTLALSYGLRTSAARTISRRARR